MKFFYRLERKYSKFAIKNLMNYLIALYIIGFFVDESFYYNVLSLNMEKIFEGEVWRLFTFIIAPPTRSVFWIIFSILFYHYIGKVLDTVWGSFRFNIYIFMGILFHILGSFLIYVLFRKVVLLDTENLGLSLFLAYGSTFPEAEFRIYFAFPVKAKVLAIFYFAIELLSFFVGDLTTRISIFFSLLNFLVFFILTGKLKSSIKDIKVSNKVHENKLKFDKIKAKSKIHICEICGKTSDSDENLQFRYCSKCDGSHEYCEEHIFTHIHIKEDR